MIDALTCVYYVLIHVGLVVWAAFTIRYGVTRKFEDTEAGRNAFIVSLGLTLMFALAITGIWWQGAGWRVIAALVIAFLLTAAGIQRIYMLGHNDEEKDD